MMSSEEIYAEFRKYQDMGVIQYVLPTEPLGVEWTLGIRGDIHKLIGDEQAVAWLDGAATITCVLTERAGLPSYGMAFTNGLKNAVPDDLFTREIH